MEEPQNSSRWFIPTFQSQSNTALSPLITCDSFIDKECFVDRVSSFHELNSIFAASGSHSRFPPMKLNFSLDSITVHPCIHDDTSSRKNSVGITKTRGRPSTDTLQKLCLDNMHRHKCPDCHRSFPRKKSLDTHLLTHSNVKPYICDYPGCTRKFKQSGQLKTHLRLHTGEKPFQCSFPSCNVSFTHANRKCPHHPMHPLYRVSGETATLFGKKLQDNENAVNWLRNKYLRNPYHDKSLHFDSLCNSQPLKSSNISNGLTDEEQKRMLSAVALVELQTQSGFLINSGNKENE